MKIDNYFHIINQYFGIIFDLIIFAMNIYIRTLYYIHETSSISYYNIFLLNFSKIIRIEFNDNFNELLNQIYRLRTPSSLDILIDNYVDVKDNYINMIQDQRIKNHYNLLLEGLFYFSLYLNFRGVTNNITSHSMSHIHMHSHFLIYIQNILNRYINKLTSDRFIMNLIQGEMNLDYSSSSSSYELVNSGGNTYQKLTLEETMKAYENYYITKNLNNFSYKKPIKINKKT